MSAAVGRVFVCFVESGLVLPLADLSSARPLLAPALLGRPPVLFFSVELDRDPPPTGDLYRSADVGREPGRRRSADEFLDPDRCRSAEFGRDRGLDPGRAPAMARSFSAAIRESRSRVLRSFSRWYAVGSNRGLLREDGAELGRGAWKPLRGDGSRRPAEPLLSTEGLRSPVARVLGDKRRR